MNLNSFLFAVAVAVAEVVLVVKMTMDVWNFVLIDFHVALMDGLMLVVNLLFYLIVVVVVVDFHLLKDVVVDLD
jgi:hypothetical protein